MIEFTLPRTVQGFETSTEFILWPAMSENDSVHSVCSGGCGDSEREHISPAGDFFSFLCRPCSYLLPVLAGWRKVGWPDLRADEVERLWILARAAQIADFAAREARKNPGVRISVPEVAARLESALSAARAK